MSDKVSGSGFTLIELMILIGIVAILAALAVSAYQTYTVREQVVFGLATTMEVKISLIDAYRRDGVAPLDRPAADLSPNVRDTHSNFVRDISILNGRIDVTYGGPLAHPDIVDEVISLTPYETDSNTIVWRCGNAPAPADGELISGAVDHRPSTVDARYLPRSCR